MSTTPAATLSEQVANLARRFAKPVDSDGAGLHSIGKSSRPRQHTYGLIDRLRYQQSFQNADEP